MKTSTQIQADFLRNYEIYVRTVLKPAQQVLHISRLEATRLLAPYSP